MDELRAALAPVVGIADGECPGCRGRALLLGDQRNRPYR